MHPTKIYIDATSDETIDQFYYNNKCILQILNSPTGFNLNEIIKIQGDLYIINRIIHDPGINIISYYIDIF